MSRDQKCTADRPLMHCLTDPRGTGDRLKVQCQDTKDAMQTDQKNKTKKRKKKRSNVNRLKIYC